MSNSLYFMLDGKAYELVVGGFEKETDLQKIVEDNPNLLARSFDDALPLKLYLVDREFGTYVIGDSGTQYSADHILVDETGIPVIVEVKRSSDTRIKREVVAQMLDYACRSDSWDVNLLREKFCQKNFDAPEGMKTDEFWGKVSDNLHQHHLRLAFVADVIPDTLKVLIQFMDTTMKDIEVYGVELRPYRDSDSGHLLLASSFVGNPVPSESKASASRVQEKRIWSHDSFIDRVREVDGAEVADLSEDIIRFCERESLTSYFGTGAKLASYMPKNKNGATVFTLAQDKDSHFYFYFHEAYLQKLSSEYNDLDKLIPEINDLFKSGMQGQFKLGSSQIRFPASNLCNDNARKAFKEIIRKLISDN